mmetsp:Transcript_7430/g.19317  ORF Transcript_7430/g.19317 Transcript_7430/m.19317 type:complete len:229 (+) Transcript_7430:127-813(+)
MQLSNFLLHLTAHGRRRDEVHREVVLVGLQVLDQPLLHKLPGRQLHGGAQLLAARQLDVHLEPLLQVGRNRRERLLLEQLALERAAEVDEAVMEEAHRPVVAQELRQVGDQPLIVARREAVEVHLRHADEVLQVGHLERRLAQVGDGVDRVVLVDAKAAVVVLVRDGRQLAPHAAGAHELVVRKRLGRALHVHVQQPAGEHAALAARLVEGGQRVARGGCRGRREGVK